MLVPVSSTSFSCLCCQVLTCRQAYSKNSFFSFFSEKHCLVSVNVPVKSLTILIYFDFVFCAVRDFERQLPSNPSDTCTCSLIRHTRLAGAFVLHILSWSLYYSSRKAFVSESWELQRLTSCIGGFLFL